MSLIVTEEQYKADTQCKGCYKFYVSEVGLEQHIKRSPLCAKWISILKQDDKFSKKIQNMYNVSNNFFHGTTCNACDTTYSNLGNLNKHLENNPVCKKLIEHEKNLMYKHLDDIQGVGNVKPEPVDDPIREKYTSIPESVDSKLIHIIWNVFLTDKTHIKNLDHEINSNCIKYIIYILPDKKIYDEIRPETDIEHCIIEYEEHSPVITNNMTEKFEKCFDKIEYYRAQKIRGNTLVLCNSGYQRSLPFICKYLITRHVDEVPDIDKALDIVLFQADKQNYANIKPFVKENLLMLLKEDSTSYF